jgi:serine protease Do
MTEVIEKLNQTVIQVATPTGNGTGFYLKSFGLIVTNNHVINGYSEAVISGAGFKKTLAEVLFFDPVFDLAFIKAPEGLEMPDTPLGDSKTARAGDSIIAIGHPFGISFTATQGIISKSDSQFNNISYLQVDAAINPGNSGGPLLNTAGEIIGVNTFIIANGNSLGFALPSNTLKESLEEYKILEGKRASRCSSCHSIISELNIEDGYCANCGAAVNEFFLNPRPYVAAGVGKIIEEIIVATGRNVEVARMGPNNWELEESGLKVHISYNPGTKFIVIDTLIAKLPKTGIGNLYEYLLNENYHLKGIGFSVSYQDIILSMLLYELYLTTESGASRLSYYLEKVGHYSTNLERILGPKVD